MTPRDPVDQLLALDPNGRGIAGFFRPGGAREAARSLRRGARAIVTTGFVLEPGRGETDGPPGAAVLGRALRALGQRVRYLVDETTAPLMEATLKALAEPVDLDVVSRARAAREARDLVLRERPSHLVSVERPGRAADGDYKNARGRSVAALNAPIDEVFLRPPRPVVTVGIGDGGNEIGMGSVRVRLLKQGALMRKIASVVRADHLVVSGVSNWGAYGVVAHLSILARRALLHTPDEERRMVAACVEAGAVDGRTRRPEPTVDALPLEVHAAFVELLRALAGRQIEGGARS
jgi:hypothetical protein